MTPSSPRVIVDRDLATSVTVRKSGADTPHAMSALLQKADIHAKCQYRASQIRRVLLEVYRLELPILLLLDPLMDVALDPLIDVPLEPTTGVLGATGALLGAVLPMPLPNGVTLGIAVGRGGRKAIGLPGDRPLPATHCLTHLLLCSPV